MVYYDPFMPEMYDDPFPVYAELRAKSPVHFMERHDAWALSLFEDVWMAGQDPETFRRRPPTYQKALLVLHHPQTQQLYCKISGF